MGLKAGILAAGEGSRLRPYCGPLPKPLLPIAGIPLIDRVILAAQQVGVTEVVAIVNQVDGDKVVQHVRGQPFSIPITFVQRTTPNSMYSLFALAEHLAHHPFLLFTVDTVFRAGTLEGFLEATKTGLEVDLLLAVTSHIDDEKPLRLLMDEQYRISQLGDGVRESRYITAGLYYCSPRIFNAMGMAKAKRLGALREFFALLVEQGYAVYGHPIPEVIDVDRPQDMAAAEQFLAART